MAAYNNMAVCYVNRDTQIIDKIQVTAMPDKPSLRITEVRICEDPLYIVVSGFSKACCASTSCGYSSLHNMHTCIGFRRIYYRVYRE